MEAKPEILLSAQLAKIALQQDEAASLAEAWASFVPRLDALAAASPDTAPMWYPHEQTCPMRDDVVQPSMQREVLLENAPVAQDGCFVVPRLVE